MNFNAVLQNASDSSVKNIKESDTSKTANLIKDIVRRSLEIRDQTIVIKLPSVVIGNDDLLINFAENVQLLNSCGTKIFIVHDHAQLVGETLKLFGLDEKFINNIRVGDHKSAQITEMVLSGYINKRVVSKLCSVGCYAVGISGKDGDMMQAKKSRLMKKSNSDGVIDMGFLSEPVMINTEVLLGFSDSNLVSVISPIASDAGGSTHFVDVDLTASVIASGVAADHLVLPYHDINLGIKSTRVRDIKSLHKILTTKKQNSQINSLLGAAISAITNDVTCIHLTNAKEHDSILFSMLGV